MVEQDLIQSQYRKISFHSWREEIFKDGIPKEAETFWAAVFEFQRSDGEKPYQHLAAYALSALSVQVSNAIVESLFSGYSCEKQVSI